MVKTSPGEERALQAGWVDFGDGVQVTQSAAIVAKALEMIKRYRILCTVVAKGYESGQVTMVSYDRDRIVLDRPPDWPQDMSPQPLRVLFRDRGRLWNQFAVELREEIADTLIISQPTRYVVLQRRSNYRVSVPQGSRIDFRHRDTPFSLEVENISGNGALLTVSESRGMYMPPEPGKMLDQIILTFPMRDEKLEEEKQGEEKQAEKKVRVAIERGRVVRSFRQRGVRYVGVHFLIRPKEEQGLLAYVRQREQELLRRGMAD